MSDLPLQRIVPFEGDELVAARQSDGTILVAFSRLCEHVGVEPTGTSAACATAYHYESQTHLAHCGYRG